MKQFSILAAIVLCFGVLVLARQDQDSGQQPPVFRAAVNYVQLDVIVTDRDGHPVADLRPDEFEIVENGAPQKIAEFSFVNIPVERAEAPLVINGRPLEADVLSNGKPEGRVYFIVLDDLHIGAATTNKAKTVARTFIEQHVGPNDLAAVVFTGSGARDAQDFTNNRTLLLAAVDRLTGRGGGSTQSKGISGGETIAVLAAAKGLESRQTVKALADVFHFLKEVRGRRKAMLLVSEGFAVDRIDALAFDPAVGLDRDIELASTAATRSGVSIYPVDPRGLDTGLDAESSSIEESASNRSADLSNRAGLWGLAADTGGFAIANTNSFEANFDRLVAENSSYYLLGYYTSERRDGSTRPTVRVNRPGVRVRVRGSVQTSGDRRPGAPQPGTPARPKNSILDASSSPVPVNDVGIRVTSSILKGEKSKDATVALVTDVDVSRFDFAETGGRFNNEKLVLRFLTTDAKGKVRKPIDRFTIDMNLRPESYELAKKGGVRIVSRLLLPPGRYQVRVVGGHENSEAGSVVYDLDVPDFSKAQLSMSGVLFTASGDAGAFTMKPPDPERRQWWSQVDFATTPPTTSRTFSNTDTIGLATEFYAKSGKTLRALSVRADLLNPDGQVVKTLAEAKAPESMEGDRYLFHPRVSLRDVPPGRYVLRVEGRAGSSDKLQASRDIEVHVR